MVSGRSKVQLSDQEIGDFLIANMKVQVATIGRAGEPHLTTLFYVPDRGRIAFWTYASSQKVMNLRRDPRISCLVEDGEDYGELRGVSIQGRAVLVEDYDEIRALGTRVMTRMAGGVDPSAGSGHGLGELGEEIVSGQARKRIGVIVEPEKVASWDHRKMRALPGQGSK